MSNPLSSPRRPQTDIRRVGILFSGGPAPAANAVIASAAGCFSRAGITVYGFLNGYTHLQSYELGQKLQEGVAYRILRHGELDGRRSGPGILIGTARANPGKAINSLADFNDPKKTALLRAVYGALCSEQIDALVSIGGDDTLTTAYKFKRFQDSLPDGERRIRVVHLPKTIDNDYAGIDFTFGYFTAVDMLATQVRNLLADAQAAKAWYVVQVMGRKAGWLSYGASIAGEGCLAIGLEDIPPEWKSQEVARFPKTGEPLRDEQGREVMRDVILLDRVVDRIARTVRTRIEQGRPYGVIVIAEGIAEFLSQDEMRHCISEDEYLNLEPDSFGHFPVSQLKFTGRVGRLVAAQIKKELGLKLKISGLQFGYEVRCHRPTAFDVILGSQLGVGAYRALAEEGKNGVMVSVADQLRLVYRPFETLVNEQEEPLRATARLLEPEEDFHQLARYLEDWVGE